MAARKALGTHWSDAWQDDAGDDGAHGHGPPGREPGAVGARSATPVAVAAGWVFGIDEALAALNTAVGRLLGRPEVAPQPGALTAGTRTGKLIGPGWHKEPGAAVATDVHVRVSVRGWSRSRTVAVARSKESDSRTTRGVDYLIRLFAGDRWR